MEAMAACLAHGRLVPTVGSLLAKGYCTLFAELNTLDHPAATTRPKFLRRPTLSDAAAPSFAERFTSSIVVAPIWVIVKR